MHVLEVQRAVSSQVRGGHSHSSRDASEEAEVQEEPLQDPNYDVLVVLNTTERPSSLLRWIS